MSYIVGSGWWCNGTGKYQPGAKSSDRTRMPEIFDIWYDKVSRFTNPEKIVVVNSASPIVPDLSDRKDVVMIDLLDNFNTKPLLARHGAAFNANTGVSIHRTAATRQVFLSAWYALYNDVDYYVWIEQDCLIHGNVVERAIEEMKKTDADFSMGDFTTTWKETSFIVLKTKSLPKIWEAYANATSNRPEPRYKEMGRVLNCCMLPFGYGRNRPINWDDEFIFAQHLTDEELDTFIAK